ncbi:MAG: rhamnulokinase [Treponema sp.]|nr:rhamnulokinase [Treponema sp.]
MADHYLAIDLGASGGRLILGHVEGGALVLSEVHRFSNAPDRKDGSLVWDVDRIFNEIAAGLEKCAAAMGSGGVLRSAGIDTWGVDYVLVDKEGKIIEPAFAYRDLRTEPFFKTLIPDEELYAISGIAFQPFNTIYQVLADKAAGRLEKAEYMLQLPEYFSHRLTGNLRNKEYNEYTMASTTGLVDAAKKVWAKKIFEKLDLPLRLFKPLRLPPYDIGGLSGEMQARAGFDTRVVMIASHDTASAVATVEEGSLYISSGTWSLLGVVGEPILSEAARAASYTNEGARNGRIRFLKNIMGLWVLQSVRRELNDAYSFAELEAMARNAGKNAEPDWTIDLNLPRFFSPVSMITEIKAEYKLRGKKAPESPGELAFAVYTSLANCYKTAIADLEKITGKKYPAISVIGGGSRDSYLNALTAAYTGKKVYAGPTEATAAGNILLQMQAAGDRSVKDGFANLVKRSFDIKEYADK